MLVMAGSGLPLRNKKNINIDGKKYWLKELTVADVFELENNLGIIDRNHVEDILLFLFEDQLILKSITNCPLQVLINLRASEFKEVGKVFLSLNHLLFGKKNQSGGRKRESFVNGLFALFCSLIEAGHVDVLNYGFSFFIKAVNNHELIKNTNIVSMADAVRVAHYGNDEQWKRHVRSLVG